MILRTASKGSGRRALARWSLLAQIALAAIAGVPADAIVVGTDDRMIANVSDAKGEARYDGVGRIECAGAGERSSVGLATGWVVGSADTVITAAHIFFPTAGPGRAPRRVVDPGRCMFALYDHDGQIRDRIGIRYGVSLWADPGIRGDSSYDVAVVKLARPANVTSLPAIGAAAPVTNPAVRLVAFHSGLGADQRRLVTGGRLRVFPNAAVIDGAANRITNAARLFLSSADSSPGSSGGMYYDARYGAAVGLHIGSLCLDSGAPKAAETCVNFGLRFDRSIIALVDNIVHDAPLANRLIGTGRPLSPLAAAPRTHAEG